MTDYLQSFHAKNKTFSYGTYKDVLNQPCTIEKQTATIKNILLNRLAENKESIFSFMRQDIKNHKENPREPLNQLTIALNGNGAHS